MEIETTLSGALDVAGKKAKYDEACKRILSEKIVLAWILKSCLDEYRDCDVNDIAQKYIEGKPEISKVPVAPDETNSRIVGMSTEDASPTEKKITYDVRFFALAPTTKESIRLIINVEAQNDFKPGYPLLKRAIYYCGRMLSAQYGTEFNHSHYEKLKKVVSIWICLSATGEWKNTITRYRVKQESLVGHAGEAFENYDLLSVVLFCLGSPDEENYEGILKLLGTLFSSEIDVEEKRKVLTHEFDIAMTQELEGGISEMCNFSDGIWEAGINQGMEKGRAEGRAEGRVEGRAEGRTESRLSDLQSLIKNTGWSVDKAMSVLEIPEAERETYISLLK